MSVVDVGWPLPGRAIVGNPSDFGRRWLHEYYSPKLGSTGLGDREGHGAQPPPDPHFHCQPHQCLKQNPPSPNNPTTTTTICLSLLRCIEQDPRGQEHR